MSDPTHTTPAAATGAPAPADDPHGIRKDLDNPGQLVMVFVAVLGLALVNVYVSWAIGPKPFSLPLQLAIGSVQAGLVAYYFMHLRQSDGVVILTALSALFWMFIMFVLILSDYFTRHLLVG